MKDKQLRQSQENSRIKLWEIAHKAWNRLDSNTSHANNVGVGEDLHKAIKGIEALCNALEALDESFI